MSGTEYYDNYPGQEESERAGPGESSRGLIGDTFKFLKQQYKSHHGQQQTYDPSSYTVSPPSSSCMIEPAVTHCHPTSGATTSRLPAELLPAALVCKPGAAVGPPVS